MKLEIVVSNGMIETNKISNSGVGFLSSRWVHILGIGFLVGTLDALAAIVVYQANPARMFRFIASGAFGAGEAFSGGSVMIVWGILFHYLIAFSWTILLFFLYPVVPILSKNRFITGAIYGILVWVIMNKIVLPLSLISQGPFNVKAALIGASILVVAVGLPIALLTHRYYLRTGSLSADS